MENDFSHIADAFAYGVGAYKQKNWSADMSEEYTRSRSFVERYVIERAATFTKGNERQEAFMAALDGFAIFDQMGGMDADYRRRAPEAAQNVPQRALELYRSIKGV